MKPDYLIVKYAQYDGIIKKRISKLQSMAHKIIKLVSNLIVFIPLLLSAAKMASGQNVNQKKLIEFGWDYPNVSFLKANIAKMEKAPFDGVVFSFDFDIYNAFDTTQRSDLQFQYKDLSEIQWKKFTDNFLLVRGASYTGAHWLDEASWSKIIENLKKVSLAVKMSKAKGIGFDAEYYYKDPMLNPWLYKPSMYNNLSYQEVGTIVREKEGNNLFRLYKRINRI